MTYLGNKARLLLRPNPGWLLLPSALGLTCIGVLAIKTIPSLPNQPDFANQQLRWVPIALAAMALFMWPRPKQVCAAAYPFMAGVMVLLLVTILPFTPASLVPVRNGARHWIDLHFMMLQPSELAKIAFVLTIACYLRHRENYRTLGGLLLPFGLMLLPVALILKEPDLGTSLTFPAILFAVLTAAGARMKHIGGLLVIAAVLVALSITAIYTLPESMQVLEKHQRLRIQSLFSQFQGDSRYVAGVGYQQDKAMTLVGSGEVHGLGAERAAMIMRHNYLPEGHNDMIFAVVVNRWGWMGGMVTLALFAVLILSFLMVAAHSKDPFARLVVVGFAALMLAQVAINIGMSLGLAPIIGITLPLVSYGGSSLVVTYAMLGLVVNFAVQRPAILARPSFEFDRAEAALS